MGRRYILGEKSRNYCNYSNSTIQKALLEVRRNKLSIRKASEKYNVPKSTLSDHLKVQTVKKYGRPTALSIEDENYLLEALLLCSEWGFPMKTLDTRLIVQSYLNRSEKKVKIFKNNLPGNDCIQNFLKRNPALTVRLCENVKRCRAKVSPEVINLFYDNLEETLAGVPPANIVNYDETNFTDDPGSVKVVVRRETRHPERILDSSKSSISVMMAVTGDGKMLPPYTVYKASNLYPTWVEGGVPGTRYNRSVSGWFDMQIFEDWFLKTCLPYLKDLPGRKVMFGDNLASHVSPLVIKTCIENNISFVLLPPNATHLVQPLDVAFFRPMKISWRNVLEIWKMKHKGVLPKSSFPSLLSESIENIAANISKNIISGFRACGIIPINRNEVLKRMPFQPDVNNSEEPSVVWSETLLEFLKENRCQKTPATEKKRGKKLNVAPGSSIGLGDLSILEDDDSNSLICDMEIDEVGIENRDEEVLKEGEFIIVTDSVAKNPRPKIADKSEKKCLGQLVNIISENEYEVKFLRKKNNPKNIYFSFPKVPIIETVSRIKIKSVVRGKDIGRGRYTFSDVDYS